MVLHSEFDDNIVDIPEEYFPTNGDFLEFEDKIKSLEDSIKELEDKNK